MIGLAQLMVVLDLTVMNIALPSAQRALHFSAADRRALDRIGRAVHRCRRGQRPHGRACLTNAIFALTGTRIRRLPLTKTIKVY